MTDSYKNGFDFVAKIVKILDKPIQLTLRRRNGSQCYCPFSNGDFCNSNCPHFVIEHCSICDKKCQIILSCGRYSHSRYVEMVE
jgi:hypothetical protein